MGPKHRVLVWGQDSPNERDNFGELSGPLNSIGSLCCGLCSALGLECIQRIRDFGDDALYKSTFYITLHYITLHYITLHYITEGSFNSQ